MALDTTVAGASSNSYATVDDADAYLATRSGFDITEWDSLEIEGKEMRLMLAATILEQNFAFRGVPASNTQALIWPRIFSGEGLQLLDSNGDLIPWDDWSDLTAFAQDAGLSPPTIPAVVKYAQIEIAFQVVHNHLLKLSPMETGDTEVSTVKLDSVTITTAPATSPMPGSLNKGQFDATSIVRLYLSKYLVNSRMYLV